MGPLWVVKPVLKKLGLPDGSPSFSSFHQLYALYRNATTCPRVQVSSGLNVVALVPLVMPSATAQATASS